jgi:hypothetical protein
MKRALLFVLLLSATAAKAQNYSIDWFTIDGGGGTSTGGVYSVSGTIGQPDAGHMTGGNFTLDGGFWGIIAAIQTPGSPLLRIFLTTTNSAVIAWPSSAVGFNLEQNGVASSSGWAPVTNTVNTVGAEKQVTVQPPAGNRFFRLKSP